MPVKQQPAAGQQGEGEAAYIGGRGAGRILYRAMREDPAGGPMIGPTARTLGVRPNVDIPVMAGQVGPNSGGMSVAPDRPDNLHPLRRPPGQGGLGKDPVWYISVDLLGGDLRFREDSVTHGLVEPARIMTIDRLQKAIAATKPHWRKLP
jgi:hypothetical protein